ncbi:MAG: class I SAM-dependent methyltransferase [Erythrobacter sp.]
MGDRPLSPGAGSSASDIDTIDYAKAGRQLAMDQAFHPEARVSGFSHLDPEVMFFTQVAALLEPEHTVLDFGAGRGEWFEDDPSRYRRWLQDFRGRCAFVDGCDVDLVVETNRTLDRAQTFEPGGPLPYEDARFDLIVSRYVFEHLPDPRWAARELLRVTKPGGWICAITPNKWGYLALLSRLVPNDLHARVLRFVQPGRKEADVFPTTYTLNTPTDIKRHFGADADVFCFRTSATPTYHFGRRGIYRAQALLHRLLPPQLDKGLCVFIRKHDAMPADRRPEA